MDHKSTSQLMAEAMQRARRHWETRRKAEAALAATPIPAIPVPPAFTIALSREAGANGSLVAREVGARLGWPVYDQELLRRIADEMGLRASLLESVDEKRVGWLQEYLATFRSVPTVSKSAYVQHLVETLLSLSTHGDCVIVGRAAAQILPLETTLRIRLVGLVQDRIAQVRQRFGVGYEEAARWVEKTDHERTAFVKDHFRKDPTDPRLYDLVLNSSRFSTAECADLILEALRRLQARTTPARPGAPVPLATE